MVLLTTPVTFISCVQGCLEVDESAVLRAGSQAVVWRVVATDGILVRKAWSSITAHGHTEFFRNPWRSYTKSGIFLQTS